MGVGGLPSSQSSFRFALSFSIISLPPFRLLPLFPFSLPSLPHHSLLSPPLNIPFSSLIFLPLPCTLLLPFHYSPSFFPFNASFSLSSFKLSLFFVLFPHPSFRFSPLLRLVSLLRLLVFLLPCLSSKLPSCTLFLSSTPLFSSPPSPRLANIYHTQTLAIREKFAHSASFPRL